jgi:hypothetical protein
MQLQLILIVSFSPHKQYFGFFEEAFNYIANKGYARMSMDDEEEWKDTLNYAYDSVEGEMKSGKLLMVLRRSVSVGDDVSPDFYGDETNN